MRKFLLLTALLFPTVAAAEICKGYGPQTPRDIAARDGTNAIKFPFAPDSSKMNL